MSVEKGMNQMSIIRVLSAGAPKGGVARTAELFEKNTGHSFEITFAPVPKIKEAIEAGAAEADVVVAAVPVLQVNPGRRAETRSPGTGGVVIGQPDMTGM